MWGSKPGTRWSSSLGYAEVEFSYDFRRSDPGSKHKQLVSFRYAPLEISSLELEDGGKYVGMLNTYNLGWSFVWLNRDAKYSLMAGVEAGYLSSKLDPLDGMENIGKGVKSGASFSLKAGYAKNILQNFDVGPKVYVGFAEKFISLHVACITSFSF
jgi:hypothetical protein